MQTLLEHDALTRLADDAAVTAWLLPDGDPVRAYLSMLSGLPADEEAWLEVLEPWLGEMQRGITPGRLDTVQVAAIGAAGVSALRAARELPRDTPLARALQRVARWAFYVVRPSAH